MSAAKVSPTITLRIPGDWAHPGELLGRLQEGYRLTPDALFMPDETSIEFSPMAPDEQFPRIFEDSCRRSPQDEELAVVARYTVNVVLSGPGGSIDAARTMMQAGSAIVRAGGAGVFIDNSGVAHGGGDWLDLTDDGGPDAMSFAFAAIVSGAQEVYTLGLHVMGFPDLLMRRADLEEDGDTIIDILRYVCDGRRPIGVGHILADEQGPRFQVVAQTTDDFPADSPLHNPFGRLNIRSAKDVAEGN